jgi:4-hydroxy-tetrahydrodipicolinate synthase
MGEFWALTVTERKRVHELVVEQTAGRIPLIAHTGHHVYSEVIELCDHAQDIGIDFAIVMNPYLPTAPADELVENWYHQIAAASSVPLFLFNTRYSGYCISPSLIARLADIDTVCGIKNPREEEHILEVQRLVGDRIVVTDASEADWLHLHLDHGFQALMSTLTLALYQTPKDRRVLEYTTRADAGDIEGAWEVQRSLEPHRHVYQKWVRGASERGIVPIAYLKAWLGLMGIPQGPVRPPLVSLTLDEQDGLRRELDGLGLVSSVPMF